MENFKLVNKRFPFVKGHFNVTIKKKVGTICCSFKPVKGFTF